MFGGCYFAGYVISMLICQPIVDEYGRKWTFFIARFSQALIVLVIVFLPSGA
jgi:MFS family permease